MFSFAGDLVLDPFLGTGSTSIAASRSGRNSLGNELEPAYLKIASQRLSAECSAVRAIGPTIASVVRDAPVRQRQRARRR